MKHLLNRVVNWVSWHRRIVGAVLAATSVFMVGSTLTQPTGPTRPAVVLTDYLPAGHTLTEPDVRLIQLPPAAIPDGALITLEDLAGQSTTVALGAGTVLQPTMFTASHHTEPGRALVPITLRDEAMRALLRPGDRVTLIAAGYDEVQTLTSDARIATLAPPPDGSPLGISSTDQGALILVDVPATDAPLVAAFGQDGALRLIFGGS